MSTLAQKWQSFSSAIIPGNAPEIQRSEMRRAFYAGSASMLSLQLNMDENMSEEDSVALLQSWQSECEDFAKKVVNGEA